MPVAEKLDLYKLHKDEYVKPKTPVLIKIKPARYLAVEGQGKPGGELFQAQVGALFGLAYTIKMARKFAGQDYKVCGLEGQYWSADPGKCLTVISEEGLRWKLLIRVPEFVNARDLKAAAAQLEKKGRGEHAGEVKLETIREGKCVQAIHVGSYQAETATIQRMAAVAGSNGLSLRGPHHEIYISDPRRVPPERLRTILRQPVG
jgi:hypothetical protein